MRIDGKNVFLTGGGSGIGRATAVTLAENGATVFVADINKAGAEETVKAIEAVGGKGEAVQLDVSDRAAIEACANELNAKVGAMDALVGVAGWDIIQPFLDNTPDFIDKVVKINYLGQVYMCKYFLPAMIEAGKQGKVVTVASDAGRVGSMGETVYAGTKGGVIAFTKSLAREMARHNINCNCVCPGPTNTPLLRAQPEKMQQALLRVIPFKRVGEPEDLANAILFFVSDQSSYVTGQVLSISGGLTMNG